MANMMPKTQSSPWVTMLLMMLVSLGISAQQTSPPDSRFEAAAEAMERAREAGAEYLSPNGFLRGVRAYERAAEDARQGKSEERIVQRLADAESAFERATSTAERAQNLLEPAVEAREDALGWEAPQRAAREWSRAERLLADASSLVAANRIDGALGRGEEATEWYRAAEMAAIEDTVLGKARQLRSAAEDAKAERNAPRTMQKAGELMEQSLLVLAGDRYATQRAGEIAGQAEAEYRRAMRINRATREIQAGQRTTEDLLLAWERSLRDVAAAAGMEIEADAPPSKLVPEILSNVAQMADSEQRLRDDLTDRDAYIAGLEDEIQALSQELGGTSAQRDQLVMRMEEQARAREQFKQVQQMFDPQEARIFRQSDQIVLRLYGLGFASGSTELSTQATDLLGEVADAIRVYPGATVSVEGHTDSQGRAETNMKLSRQRAQAVQQHLVNEYGFSSRQFSAEGFGESSPVANNETAEGRARNRRIDVIITPEASAG